jgi:hypothetical protein
MSSSAGGTSSSAGGTSSSAQGGAAPHVVHACPTADGGIATGTWEDVTPPGVSLDSNFNTPAGTNYGANAIIVDPTDTATVYLGTSSQGIYKTTDCGSTWVHINTGTNGDQLDKGRQWTMVIDPKNPQIIYANAGYGPNGVFKSSNGGVDWDQVLPTSVSQFAPFGGFVGKITMDPTNNQHILVSFHGPCTGMYAATGCLAESTDSGATWQVRSSGSGWIEGAGQTMVDGKVWFFGASTGIWRTDNAGMSWTQVFNGAATDKFYQASDGTQYVAGSSGVVQSHDGITWTPMPNSKSSSITGDGTTMFASYGPCFNDTMKFEPYVSSPEVNPTWAPLASPEMLQGGAFMAYDSDHQLLYSSNCVGGLWRASIPR